MARLNRAPPAVLEIREDSDADTHTKTQKPLATRRKNTTTTSTSSSTASGRTLRPLGTMRSLPGANTNANKNATANSNPKSQRDEDEDEDDDDDSSPRAPTQTPRMRQRRQLGHRRSNSLLMPFPAATHRYDGLTAGRGWGDVENAPSPGEWEEYKHGVGRKGGKETEGRKGDVRGTGEGGVKGVKGGEARGKHAWREAGGIGSESEEDGNEEEENEDESDDEFDSLDDFIVGDDEDISYFEESSCQEDSDEEDEEEVSNRRRMSPRKLFRGTRPTSTTAKGTGTGGNNTNYSTTYCDCSTATVNANVARDGGVSNESNKPQPSPPLFENSRNGEDGDASEESGILSVPKSFDMKPPPASPTKSNSPKKRGDIDPKAPGDNMEGSPPNSRSPFYNPEDPGKVQSGANFITPPSSPSKPRLQSPSKTKYRIPPTPHRPSIDAFWSQDIINSWNDQYSPRKTKTGLRKYQPFSDDEDYDGDQGMAGRSSGSSSPTSSPQKSPIKGSPVKKSSVAATAAAQRALAVKKKEFDQKKEAMAEEFLKALDDCVTGGEIQKLAAAAGGVKIVWSKKLNTTAGRANWKREMLKRDRLPAQPTHQATASWVSASGHGGNAPNAPPNGSSKAAPNAYTSTFSNNTDKIPPNPPLLAPIRHHATIELASKIIDSEDRLLNTLAHEYCHLANFIISNVRNNPHGASFKQWAAKCEKALSEHPVYGWGAGGNGKVRIRITTKHSYVIHYKYLWCCVECGFEYGRHSRSIDVKKSRCGECKVGALVQVRPKPRGGVEKKNAVGDGAVKGVGKGMGMGAINRAVDGVTGSMANIHLEV
ncbi:hypothetical protein PABG_04522 [Paracoccidioides brasiliensis Pb03]|nr:hypothetical protein PABG_04522 [Paracoccidioides brasiliensis Pb03]